MDKKDYKILVVDDQKHNIDVLVDVLSPLYDVMVAKDGMTAIKMAREQMPDLILLDIVMPDISGYNVIATLKESEETHHIPVIFITSLDQHKYEEKGLELGAVDYITKPFSNAVVLARVKTHLQMVEYKRSAENTDDPDAELLADILNRLEPLLRAGDAKAVRLTDELRQIGGTEEIVRLIEDYDFAQALNALHYFVTNR